ncbi:MAG: arginine deiminase-related protein [Pseudoxanthomonas suwonensis]|nr:arginine deiminase-related protein [Pseudoxanthomonas suwonensis]
MLTRDPAAFLSHARGIPPDFGPATARAAFLVSPDGFRHAAASASDNAYMAAAERFDAQMALQQHRHLHRAISTVLPTICFAGDPQTPDAVFPNNVFATAAGRSIIGRMRHPVRQREAERDDIRRFFRDVLGREEIDLSGQPHPAELTGALVVDRARGLGFIGLSERCDELGAQRMHEAFGLRASLIFDLAPGEYHTNVVLSVLAGRAAVLCEAGFADPNVAQAIGALYAPHVIRCSAAEHAAFVGNCIALSDDTVWMSSAAAQSLDAAHRQQFTDAGFNVRHVPLDAIEAGGGSLRCCIGEIH